MTKFQKALVLIFLLLACLTWFFVEISSILLPFVLAFVLAYFLHPVVTYLEQKHFSRSLATAFVTFLFCFFVIAVFLIFVPILQAQILALMVKVPQLGDILWVKIQTVILYTKENISQEQLKQISGVVSKTIFSLFNTMGSNLLKVLTGGIVFFNIISLVLITPVVLFYVLRDWLFVEKKMSDLVPLNKKEEVSSVFKEINTALSGFIRGQASVCLLLGVYYGLFLSLVGLDFGLLVGFLSGILSFIPYFGFLTGVILSCLLALVQEASVALWIGIMIVFLGGQVLESYILTPKLVGNKVGLHPVWVIFALLAGGALFGFVGVFVAVPVAAVIGVFVRRILKWYRSTPVYLSAPKGSKKKK
ncbi:MAG: AI-2E family transporter [Alphaproteobacteria bacterium]|nr:AI-2E family transporter [Alphaproteobacteria bacterium]